MSTWDRFDDLVGGYGCLIVLVVWPLIVMGLSIMAASVMR